MQVANMTIPEIETPRPEIHIIEATDTYGQFAVEPLERGYGMTLGNPLRRVLLGSLPGAAVTWVKIEGVLHEYTSVPHMREGVLDFLQNVKAIRLHAYSDRPGKMRLETSGEGEVCAADIVAPADFEVVNPELHLAYLDSSEARLSVEFNVEPGHGYVPASSEDGLSIGVLSVDAIFTPVRKVAYSIERTRVGQFTNFERLVLEVWTDGTINPTDALREATHILLNHFFLVSNVGKSPESGPASLAIAPEMYNMPMERLELTGRTYNSLKRHGLNKVGEVLEMSRADLLKIRNFGEKSLEELYTRLRDMDLLPEEEQKAEAATEETAEETPGDEETPEGVPEVAAVEEPQQEP